MKYLMFIKHVEANPRVTPPKALMDAMEKFVGESLAKGVLKDTAGLKPSSEGVEIRSKGGKLTTTDGPFTEAKEVVGGFAIVETKTRAEALEIAHEFMELHRVHWPEFECTSEVRPIEDY